MAEVLYLKAELKYVTLRTAAHTYVLDDSLTDLEQRLGERFLRVHRNALVARGGARARELRRRSADEADAERLGGARGAAGRMAGGVAPPAARRCARRWPASGAGPDGTAAAVQPVLRSPAAMPLIERWMPRCTRSFAGVAGSRRGAVAAHQLDLQVVQRVEVGEAVLDRARQRRVGLQPLAPRR